MKIGRNETCPCGSGKKYKYCCLGKERGSSFIITQAIYEKDFLPFYNNEICIPKTFIVFEVVLPFHIPMNKGRTITLDAKEGFFSFRFDMVTTDKSYEFSIDEKADFAKANYTKIFMIAAVDIEYSKFEEDAERYNNQYFDLLLAELNNIVIGYMTVKKDEDCHYLTKEMLPFCILIRITDLDTWNNDAYLFFLHTDAPYEKKMLVEEEEVEVARMESIIVANLNPFAIGEKYVLNAKRYYKKGFYHESVLFAQISVETFIRTLYKLLLEDEGKSEEEVVKILEDTPFITIIKSKLSSYLGGRWDLTNENTEVGKWYRNTYILRNKATHSGEIPKFEEAGKAINDAIEFRQYILKRIKENKKKYPKINEYLV